ncbi:MAG: hypothetical protein ABR600_10080 [Actinomycetota bacterium]
MQVWALIGLLGGLSAAILGMMFTVIHGLGGRIDRLGSEVRSEVGGLRAEVRSEIGALGGRIDRLSTRIDGISQQLGSHVAQHDR